MVASMISVAGISAGSTIATTGAASMPMPNPIDACMHEASTMAAAITEYSHAHADIVTAFASSLCIGW